MTIAHRLPALIVRWRAWLVVALVLIAAALLGRQPSRVWLLAPIALLGGAVLLRRPILGLSVLVVASLLLPLEIGTGSDVTLNAATLLVPMLFAAWLLHRVLQRDVRLAPSRTNLPLALFLLANLLSLVIGIALWDPMVPRPNGFLLVQLAQLAIIAFSAGAYWLAGNLITSEAWLQRLTFLFIVIAGGIAILLAMPVIRAPVWRLVGRIWTLAVVRTPFWVLLAALAGGQLLYNRQLRPWQRGTLAAVCVAVAVYAFFFQRESVSNWLGVGVVGVVLVWLRWPRLRILLLALVVMLAALGVLFSALYNFAGGDTEWEYSGGSRLALSGRVIEVTMRNPITGLGPAAYRPYASVKPLPYGHAYWTEPRISAHNNYVDIFSFSGFIGLSILLWFGIEIGRLAWRLQARHSDGFRAGYANGMIAALIGALVIMALADWILPFVYNIGFPGFQASGLVWLFWGGLVALDNMGDAG